MTAVVSFNTRFLYSFFFEPDIEKQKEALINASFGKHQVWELGKPKDFYKQEFLEEATDFIFTEGQYFILNHVLNDQWLNELEVTLNGKPLFKAKASPHDKIELFLSPQGIGVLSIPLQADNVSDFDAIKRFNYQLSQAPYKTPSLSLPHNEKNPNPIPDKNSELIARLGKAGGKWTLVELRNYLLQPLQSFGLKTAVREQFSVYSVLRFKEMDLSNPKVDLSNPEKQAELRPLLAGLAHLEESKHAGSIDVEQKLLNTHHWCAVGTLAAVHFVADQGEDVAFNNQRVPIVFDKYFIVYLTALMQRLVLRHILMQANRCPHSNKNHSAKDLQALHDLLLTFMIKGYFTEISSREVINQYYILMRKALRIEEAFNTLQRALHDIDAKQSIIDAQQSAKERESPKTKHFYAKQN
ncbi:hypothetical protein [Thioflexithrix psekupsensis]|uniref:Uncharacterized protein n=1 Tax=Thioflexithrix psekupsensis TaxID=1570016 RepID=A0A251X6L6_9GAMM|nr:hypothetical protein [Thioflexithrix psekupsensis]OUD12893.1 hypothetical protein TPSD3_12170 [Thioflexithrix psekupsensis]